MNSVYNSCTKVCRVKYNLVWFAAVNVKTLIGIYSCS
jgi:hypothetical protein